MITKLIAAALALTMAISGAVSYDGGDIDRRIISELEYDYEYKGRGMVIAVIDSGFFLEHESFILTSEGRLTKENVDSAELSMYEEDKKDSYYINEKIPFAYNYADRSADVSGYESHGTAVISAAAGNNSVNPRHPSGAAPEAQILAMKVFSNDLGTAKESDVIDAIGDAVKLGADVICVAFGDECGSSEGSEKLSINSALEAARKAGVMIVSSAGEVRQRGEISPYGTDAGIIAQTTDQPDVGTISYPAASEYSFSVGSAATNVYSADCFLSGKNRIPYGDTNNMWNLPTGGVTFAEFFDGRTLAYEFVPDLGNKEDFEGLDLTGKLAVIERGVITFSEKCKNAAEKGAIGVIIVDTQPDPRTALDVRMDISESPIPAVIISSSSAAILKDAKIKEITVKTGVRYYELRSDTPTPSTFSSWGTTPELLLKPDISVVSESVECASTAENEYITTGGTAVAAARISGMLACVKEKLIADGFQAKDAAKRAENLLASSAGLMEWSDGVPYSPRKQGSGVATLGGALSAGILVTSGGGHSVSLGELSKRWFTIDVTVENLTGKDKNCEIGAIFGSDGYDSFTYREIDTAEEGETTLAEKLGKNQDDRVSFLDRFTPFRNARIFPGEENAELNLASDGGAPYNFRLGAGESVTFRLTFMIDEATFTEYSDIFPNGFFAEGFVIVTSGDEEASIPFTGFVGGFGAAPALDAELGKTAIYDNTYLWRDYSPAGGSGDRLILGLNQSGGFDRDSLRFSPTSDAVNAAVNLRLGLLRDISDVSVKVYSGGEIVSEREIGYLPRTYLEYTTNMLISPEIVLWNGRADDNYLYVFPDGDYRIEVSYRTSNGGTTRTFEYDLKLDSTPPEVKGHEFSKDGDTAVMRLETFDANGIQSCTVCDEFGGEAFPDENGIYDITSLGKYIYVELYDTAMNFRAVRFDNPYYE